MLKKLNDYETGYRKGAVFTLVALNNLLGKENLRTDKINVQLKVFLEAILSKLDFFLDYGDKIFFAYIEHDKKRRPIKAEIFNDISHYKRSKKNKIIV
ncbi:hypothetical protein IJ425_04075 [bacterium]|nr:hypothetical protein [bacterium]